MKFVDVWNAKRWKHDKHDDVAQDEVGSEEPELSNLAKVFSSRLGHRVPSHRVPFARPPSNVRRILFEFSGQAESDDQLEHKALESHDCNHTKKCFGKDPALKEEHHFPKSEEHNDSHTVSNGSEDGTKLFAAHAQDGSHTAGHGEETGKNAGVDSNRSEGDNSNPDERVCRRFHIGGNACLGIDEEVRDQGQADKDKGPYNFTEEDTGKVCTWNIARKLLRGRTKRLAFETSKSSTREPAESDPRRCMRARVSARQPSKIVSVIDEKVVPSKLMRVEDEW